MSGATRPNSFELRRKEAGLSIAEVKALTGVGTTTLSRLENGHTRRPSASVLRRLADLYTISVGELLNLPDAQEAA